MWITSKPRLTAVNRMNYQKAQRKVASQSSVQYQFTYIRRRTIAQNKDFIQAVNKQILVLDKIVFNIVNECVIQVLIALCTRMKTCVWNLRNIYIYRERRLVNIMRREWAKLSEADGPLIIWLRHAAGNDTCQRLSSTCHWQRLRQVS